MTTALLCARGDHKLRHLANEIAALRVQEDRMGQFGDKITAEVRIRGHESYIAKGDSLGYILSKCV